MQKVFFLRGGGRVGEGQKKIIMVFSKVANSMHLKVGLYLGRRAVLTPCNTL